MLYVGDKNNRSIHYFDLDGKFIKDIRLKFFIGTTISSIKDNKNNFYSYPPAESDKCIAIYNEKGELTASFLDKKELAASLFFLPSKSTLQGTYLFPSNMTIEFALVENDRLAAFNYHSGYFYIFSDNRLQEKRTLWAKKALEEHKLKSAESIREEGWYGYFNKMFVDNDNKKYFYLDFGKTKDQKKFLVYMFDVKGKLIKVLYVDGQKIDSSIRFQCKRNNLFYAIGPGKDDEKTIIIYKEEAKK